MKKCSKILCKLVPSIVAFSVVSPVSSAMFNNNSLSSCETMASSKVSPNILASIYGSYEIDRYTKSVEHLDGCSMFCVSTSIRRMAETLRYNENPTKEMIKEMIKEMMDSLNKISIADLCDENRCDDYYFEQVFLDLDNACSEINEILNGEEKIIEIKEEEKCGLENVRSKIVEMLCNKHVKSKYKLLIKSKCKKLSEYDSECDLVTAWKLEASVLEEN